jgi:hypothetical protein
VGACIIEPRVYGIYGSTRVEAQEHLGKEGVERLRQATKSTELEALWQKWYHLSGKYAEQYAKNNAKKDRQAQRAAAARQEPAAALNPKELHKLVTKRYKELR